MGQYSYSLLFQMMDGTGSGKDELQFFEEYHKAIRESVEADRAEKSKSDTESIQRAISLLRGTLIPYLSTPLKSDKDDIERSIKDTIENVLTHLGASSANGVTQLESYRILESSRVPLHRQLVGVMKRLLKNGKAMLADAGMMTGKNYGSIFLSCFSCEGFTQVLSFHSVVEKTKENGKYKEFEIFNDSLHETILSHSTETNGSDHTIMLHFEAPEVVVEKLKNKLAALLDQLGIKSIRLSRRTFFSGFGSTYQLQIVTDLKEHPLGTILLTMIGDDTELESAMIQMGSLIILEKIA